MIHVCLAPIAKSIAPPTAGMAPASPVCQVASGRDLKCAEHADVEMTAAHHCEAVGMMKKRTACKQCHRLFASIDQVIVLVARRGGWAYAQDPVLAMQDDFASGGQMVCHHRELPNAEVADGAVKNIESYSRGKLLL